MEISPSVSHEVESHWFTRFSLGQRCLHGMLVATFLGLAATGLPLRFSNLPLTVKLANLVGGFPVLLFFHKFSGVLLTAAFIVHVVQMGYKIVRTRDVGLLWGPRSLVPNLKDLKDLIAQIRWFLWLGPKPKFDRYTYWQKMDYWAVFWGMGIIGLSGYAMWFAPFFARFIPGSLLNVALVIHGEEALLAVSFIFTVHFFNENLRPGNFPMDITIFTGRQTEDEFKEKHPAEYERMVATGEIERLRAVPPPRWLRNFSRVIGTTALVIGLSILVLTVNAFVRTR
jgi:cytochrome b subunit of formate dehydrogenase